LKIPDYDIYEVMIQKPYRHLLKRVQLVVYLPGASHYQAGLRSSPPVVTMFLI